ncbi:hypothetical protein KHM83_01195 [Fusibacter paucivorans]|uniref:Uncharacterized protein n=1 Tax=Fusibacter paucivorans TaxID=76009 RepID=A0ABS5PJI1_9FIRM|nr:hypothetical protein [Fusibacter paucivorans]MBS7525285.1 hypothetical protein [Fusibacter paucivorans]
MKRNHIVSSKVFEIDHADLSFDAKMEQALDALCYHFDIQRPMWFEENRHHLTLTGKTEFKNRHFIESIDFDSFVIELIENE